MNHPVVILCRNALELTKRAVDSILAQDVPVIIRAVDNGSTDGTAAYFATKMPLVTCQTFNPGLGVSAAWNYALTDVFRIWDHCLVVNNDVVLRYDTVRALYRDGGPFVTAVSVGDPAQLQWDGETRRRYHPDFSCFLIRKEVWKTVGAFDESMVLYSSDNDYHIRMHRAGIDAYTIGVPFYHYASGTLKTATEVERTRINVQANRDRETFFKKWGFSVGSPEYYAAFNGRAPNATPDEA